MQVKQATFVTSVSSLKQMKDFGAPEIAIAGKSNVGKSSFINFLVNIKTLAKTSSTPGRTRLINYFDINKGSFMFVDLPGYGFAKVGGDDKDSWDQLIGGYLQSSIKLAGVLILVDIRHEPSVLDIQMATYLNHYQIPFVIVATKSDKLSALQIRQQKQIIANKFSIKLDDVLVTSSLKKSGKEEVLNKIEELIYNFKITHNI